MRKPILFLAIAALVGVSLGFVGTASSEAG